jgi:hypothetical protein
MPRCPHCDYSADEIDPFGELGKTGDNIITYLECPNCDAILGSHHAIAGP